MLHFIAFGFIVLHNLSGQEVVINAEQITSLTPAKDDEGKKLLVEGVACAVGMTNGKFHTVIETCHAVVKQIEFLGGKVGP